MITIITGLPGDGKTLFALDYISRKAEKENRPVYYSGINDLRLPWIEMPEADKWMDCPDKCIIVIDEAQRAFRPRSTGAQVPPHVAALETHRHRGLDIFLITQQPMLMEVNVRRLCAQHFHIIRNFGLQRATIHEFQGAKVDCEKSEGRKDSVRSEWAYPKEVFALYKSAELHTARRRIPARIYLMLTLPFLAAASIWYFYLWAKQHATGEPLKAAAVASASPASTGLVRAPAPRVDGTKTRDAYISERQPRIEGLAYTAPVYDAITQPTRAPYPAMCLSSAPKSGEVCRCYSEQGTRLSVPEALCKQIVHDGFYQDWGDISRPTPVDPSVSKVAPAPAAQHSPSSILVGGSESGVEGTQRVLTSPERQNTVPANSSYRIR